MVKKSQKIDFDLERYFDDDQYQRYIHQQIESKKDRSIFNLTKPMLTDCISRMKSIHTEQMLDNLMNRCGLLLYYGQLTPKQINIIKKEAEDEDNEYFEVASNQGQFSVGKWDDGSLSITRHYLFDSENISDNETLDDIKRDNITNLNFIKSVLYPKKTKK